MDDPVTRDYTIGDPCPLITFNLNNLTFKSRSPRDRCKVLESSVFCHKMYRVRILLRYLKIPVDQERGVHINYIVVMLHMFPLE